MYSVIMLALAYNLMNDILILFMISVEINELKQFYKVFT